MNKMSKKEMFLLLFHILNKKLLYLSVRLFYQTKIGLIVLLTRRKKHVIQTQQKQNKTYKNFHGKYFSVPTNTSSGLVEINL